MTQRELSAHLRRVAVVEECRDKLLRVLEDRERDGVLLDDLDDDLVTAYARLVNWLDEERDVWTVPSNG
jgi:hypothetical protein